LSRRVDQYFVTDVVGACGLYLQNSLYHNPGDGGTNLFRNIEMLFQYTPQDGKGALAPPRFTKTIDSVSVYISLVFNQLRLTPTAPWITGGSRISHP